MRFLALAIVLLVADTAYAFPSFSMRGEAPAVLRRIPRGWSAPKTITPKMHAFAESLLPLKLGTWRERRIEGKRVAARVEWHFWPEKGWHKGVTVYEVRRRAR